MNDLKAQVAACVKGAAELHAMVRQFGRDVVLAYMRHVQDNAEESGTSRPSPNLTSGQFTCRRAWTIRYRDHQGHRIDIDVDRRSAAVDFTGTSAAGADVNFNAPDSR